LNNITFGSEYKRKQKNIEEILCAH